jgi:thiosulfate dehydrogenase (quinone) large subunit
VLWHKPVEIIRQWQAGTPHSWSTFPNAGLFSFLVTWGEILVGIGLILGAATIPALLAGAFMNLNFMLAGTTSTNPVLYTIAVILLFAGTGTYYYGVDRFAIPCIKEHFGKDKGKGINKFHHKAPAH